MSTHINIPRFLVRLWKTQSLILRVSNLHCIFVQVLLILHVLE